MKNIFFGSVLVIAMAVVAGCNTAHSHGGGEDIPRVALENVKATSEGRVDAQIKRAQGWIKSVPTSPKGYNALGLALMQKGRETSDLNNYNAALTAFEKAVELAPKDSESLHNLAWAYTMFHRFAKAIENANLALQNDKKDPFAYGVLFDSFVELGRYDEAAQACQKMVDQRPDLASYSRAAQMRWIDGDVKMAILLMQKAVSAGGAYAENAAWCETQLGDMYFKTGAFPAAEQAYARVLERMPDFRHANFGLGKVRASQGKLSDAVALMSKAMDGNPPIPYVLEYSDVLMALGREEDAKEQLARVETMVAEHQKHGILGDELALAAYYLDYAGKFDKALELTESEVKEHTSWQSFGTHAWALYKAGQYEEAKKAMAKARRTGIQEARLIYRDGLIRKALGETEEATKLMAAAQNLNPHFEISPAVKP